MHDVCMYICMCDLERLLLLVMIVEYSYLQEESKKKVIAITKTDKKDYTIVK